MPNCVFDKKTGLFVRGVQHGKARYDRKTQVRIDLPDYPSMDQRWDKKTGLRAATAQEKADRDEAIKDTEIARALDNNKTLQAIVEWTAGKLKVSLSQAQKEITEIYKSL